jgi:hypothetical protein
MLFKKDQASSQEASDYQFWYGPFASLKLQHNISFPWNDPLL